VVTPIRSGRRPRGRSVATDLEQLNFLMDSRTGLGRFRDFSISNFELMMKLIHACHQLEGVEEILAMEHVRERSELFHAHTEPFIDQLRRVTTRHDDVVVVDLRGEDIIYAGNRFMVYALYPEARPVRRRRPPRGRRLPGGQRRRRAGARRAHPGAGPASRRVLSRSTARRFAPGGPVTCRGDGRTIAAN